PTTFYFLALFKRALSMVLLAVATAPTSDSNLSRIGWIALSSARSAAPSKSASLAWMLAIGWACLAAAWPAALTCSSANFFCILTALISLSFIEPFNFHPTQNANTSNGMTIADALRAIASGSGQNSGLNKTPIVQPPNSELAEKIIGLPKFWKTPVYFPK